MTDIDLHFNNICFSENNDYLFPNPIELDNNCNDDKDEEIIFNNNNIPLILTSYTSNKKLNLTKKFCDNYDEPYLIKRIFSLFSKFVVYFLNDNFKINKNIKFRFIKPIHNYKAIQLLMKKNIKCFCDLNISEKNKRKKNKYLNKKWLKQIKKKIGGEILKIKLSTLYKKLFLSESSEISIKSLTKKIDNNLNFMLINRHNIYNLLKNKKKKCQYEEKLIDFAKKFYLKIRK